MNAPSPRTLVIVAAATIQLAACTVGPKFSPPTADLPAAWVAASGAAASSASTVSFTGINDTRWWIRLGDPELSSLVERAVVGSFDARQAVLRIEEARDQRRLAGAGAWPQVNASASYTDTRISERTALTSLLGSIGGGSGSAPGGVPAALPGLTNPFGQYQYGLTASWEIDLFGRVRRTVEAAEADRQAAVEDARAVRVSLAAEVASAYIDLRAAQAQRRIVEDLRATAHRTLALASDARAAGLGGDLEIASARAAAASTDAQTPPLEQRISIDKTQLTLLLALKPDALDGELDAVSAVPVLPPTVPIGLPAELARRRPDIRRAEAQLHAAVARQGVAVASLYPSVSLTAAPGFEASRTSSLTDWAASYFAVGPSLDLPIFDAGQRRTTVHLQDVRAREAALAYAQTVLSALGEVDNAIAAYDQEQARRGALELADQQSLTALDLATRRYKAGAVSFREVLDAQATLRKADLALSDSAALTVQNLTVLYKALGGGWETTGAAASGSR